MEWLAHRHLRHKEIARTQRDTIRVVFLGDSLTRQWDASLWQQHFAPLGAVNFGIGGDKSCQILWRIGDGLLDNLAPELIVLGIGANSIWSGAFTPERIGDGVLKCVSTLQTACPNARLMVLGVLPAMEPPDHPVREIIRGINTRVAPVDDGDRVRFLDAGPALLEPDGSLLITVARDGVHLTAEGYRRLASVLVPSVHTALAAESPKPSSPDR